MNNETKIQTSCYSIDKYAIYDSYCKPERYYKINCFDRVYNDVQEKLLILLVCSVVLIAIQVSNIFFVEFDDFLTIYLIFKGINYLLGFGARNKYSTKEK